MALEGSIKDFGLAEIFQLIFIQRKTGLLTLKCNEKNASIFFGNGLIIQASSTERGAVERLGEILIRANRIDKEQLEEFLYDQEIAQEKLGKMITESGLIKNEDVKKALKLQMHETIYSLFLWKEGDYQFEQRTNTPSSEFSPINTEFILMEGIRRLDEWPFLEKVLPTNRIILKKIPGKESSITLKEEQDEDEEIEFDLLGEEEEKPKDGNYQLSHDEIGIFHLIDGIKDIREIIIISPLDDFDTYKVLSNLVTTSLVEIIGEKEEKKIDVKHKKKLSYINVFNRILTVSLIIILCFGGYSLYLKEWNSIGVPLSDSLRIKTLTRIHNQIELFYLRNKRLPGSLNEIEGLDVNGFHYETVKDRFILE